MLKYSQFIIEVDEDKQDDYVYHGTNHENLRQIKKHGGLDPSPYNYVTHSEHAAHHYAVGPHDQKVVLRMKRKHVPGLEYAGHNNFGGENEKTSEYVHSKHIEYKHKNGWKKLNGD
jgi:RNA:NAD 2'-phosphotransferase (TPT1/KptA family)